MLETLKGGLNILELIPWAVGIQEEFGARESHDPSGILVRFLWQ